MATVLLMPMISRQLVSKDGDKNDDSKQTDWIARLESAQQIRSQPAKDQIDPSQMDPNQSEPNQNELNQTCRSHICQQD